MHHTGTYPASWNVIAAAVKDGADWRCVRCGHPHDPSAGRCLTVHHFDGNKSNCELWNLMALCQACHLSVQGRVDPKHTLMFEPNVWAMPYLAGLYESGVGIAYPGYRLSDVIFIYSERSGLLWPWWAPSIGEHHHESV